MQRIAFKILVFLFSLIAVTLAKDVNLKNERDEIISRNEIIKERIELPFDFTTREAFRTSIFNLRLLVATNSSNVGDMLITNAYGNEQFTLINFDIPREGRLQLVMWNVNLYIIGFINDYFDPNRPTERERSFWRFSDPEFARLTVPNTRLRQLPSNMQTTYGSLTAMARMSLREVNIDQGSLQNSLRLLYNFAGVSGDQRNFARAMLRVIVLTSESVRFIPIQRDLGQSIADFTTYYPGVNGQALLNSWDGFSQHGILLEDNPHWTEPLRTMFSVQFNGIDYNVFDRYNIFWVIAVALNCRAPHIRTDVCPAESDIVLINKTYWFKADLINYII
jgi:hypothetical protein